MTLSPRWTSILLILGCGLISQVELAKLSPLIPSQSPECGGIITSNAASLTYPPPGESLKQGELCVWTIHLDSTRDFRFNFSSFDVRSNNRSDCRFGAVRIYSLTNLSPPGSIEGYTFCEDQAPSTNFFLGNTIAVVSLYTSTVNLAPGFGFTLNWEGVSIDPLRTKHSSSYSTNSDGLIEYGRPYETNVAATWTVSQPLRVDFRLDNLELEDCSVSDKCSCDALILYRVATNGALSETKRFCGESEDDLITNIDGRFVLAFFTDFQAQPGVNGGFEVDYVGLDAPSTSPIPTASTPPPHIISTTCGETITLVAATQKGTISYKPDGRYESNERCVWILRLRNVRGITFDLDQIGAVGMDALTLSTFTRADPPLQTTQFLREQTSVKINGSVAVVTFFSDNELEGIGFVLNFEGSEFISSNISTNSRDVISSSAMGSLKHPQGDIYDNQELSFFVIAEPEFKVDTGLTMRVVWTMLGLPEGCRDFVVAYKFYTDSSWSQYDMYCATSPRNIGHTDMMLFVFMTDTSMVSTGFTLDWNLS